ncbi:hypothetical protein AM500_12340 [Bacillus sp. FJAT-18017]|uniref:hypothetical protein n=1 Tax=Bacillus sp. FJAT-18017 TaxID=1705566 RepID=UPI0006AFD509|nr:hypothetical protein [Bacillus sp. FJAT-18017]ALC90487.1 hypothetical protein AM500_12340 [Bacillus sp. FJAT-18017]
MELVDGTIIGKVPEHIMDEFLAKSYSIEIKLRIWTKILPLFPSYFVYIHGQIERYQKHALETWDIVRPYISVKVPTEYRYNISNDGVLFLTDMNEYGEKKEGERKNMANIYDRKPRDGEIIGKATEEEIKALKEISIKEDALERLSGLVTVQASFEEFMKIYEMAEELERKKIEFWVPITKRLNGHWEWKLFIDFADGSIHVQNYELPFYQETEEE